MKQAWTELDQAHKYAICYMHYTLYRYCDTIKHSANIIDEKGALVGYDFKET